MHLIILTGTMVEVSLSKENEVKPSIVMCTSSGKTGFWGSYGVFEKVKFFKDNQINRVLSGDEALEGSNKYIKKGIEL